MFRTKLYVQKKVDGATTWAERGVGLLTLQKEDSKVKLVIRSENADRYVIAFIHVRFRM